MQVCLLGGALGGHRVTPVLSPGRGAKPRNISALCFTLLFSTFSPHSHVLFSALSLPVTSFPGTPFSSVLVLTVPWSQQLRGSWPPPPAHSHRACPWTLSFRCAFSSSLPFHAVHGVLVARILEWFAVPSSSGSRSVRSLCCDPSISIDPASCGSLHH